MAVPELAAFIALLISRSGTSWPCSVPRGLFQPLSGVVVFSMVSKRFANVPSEGIHYPVLALVGLAVWSYTFSSVTRATQSLANHSPLVTRCRYGCSSWSRSCNHRAVAWNLEGKRLSVENLLYCACARRCRQ